MLRIGISKSQPHFCNLPKTHKVIIKKAILIVQLILVFTQCWL